MKILKTLLIVLPMILFVGNTSASFVNEKEAELKVKVDFHCPKGKARLEEGLMKEPGVISAIADLETKIITIKYDPAKQNQDKIVAAIEKLGHKTEFTKPETQIKSACGHGDKPKQEEEQAK